MAERGIGVSYESIRLWYIKFGTKFAKRLQRRHQGYGDTFLSTKSSSRFKVSNTIFGGQLTRTATLWMCFYSTAGTDRQQSVSSSVYSKFMALSRAFTSTN